MANHGHYLGQDNGHVLQMILFYQCVVKQWYYIGSFMDRPMCAPLNTTNEWQNNGFTWAISWANQCEAHLIPIHGETVVIQGQFHGPTLWSPYNANVCQSSGLTWALSWANQCEPQAIPMSGKTVVLHGQLHGPITRGRSAWNHVIPMCGKTVSLHGQFHEWTNVNPMQCQCVLYINEYFHE